MTNHMDKWKSLLNHLFVENKLLSSVKILILVLLNHIKNVNILSTKILNVTLLINLYYVKLKE
jgi:hypothetical protein